jgi:hypothetical protein
LSPWELSIETNARATAHDQTHFQRGAQSRASGHVVEEIPADVTGLGPAPRGEVLEPLKWVSNSWDDYPDTPLEIVADLCWRGIERTRAAADW